MFANVNNHKWQKLLFLFCLLLSSAGCSTLSWDKAVAYLPGHKPLPVGPVVEIMGLWQPGEGRDPQGLPCRGFAGQLFFFQQGSTQPAKIAGDIKIYVFDDQGSDDQQAKPIHCYEFKNEAWQAYLTETNIGNCYQVFIPYPRSGDHRAICSLRIKWTGEKGETLLSDPADIILTGKTVKASEETAQAQATPTVSNSLSTQQTHIARIGRGGKTELLTAELQPQQTRLDSNSSNLQQAGYQTQIPEWQHQQPSQVRPTSWEQIDEAHNLPNAEELTAGWSLHRQLPTQGSTVTKEVTSVGNNPLSARAAEAGTFQHPLLSPSENLRKDSSLKVQTITLE